MGQRVMSLSARLLLLVLGAWLSTFIFANKKGRRYFRSSLKALPSAVVRNYIHLLHFEHAVAIVTVGMTRVSDSAPAKSEE